MGFVHTRQNLRSAAGDGCVLTTHPALQRLVSMGLAGLDGVSGWAPGTLNPAGDWWDGCHGYFLLRPNGGRYCWGVRVVGWMCMVGGAERGPCRGAAGDR